MYRITDPHHPELADSILKAVQQCFQSHPQSTLYALVDATLDMDWAQQLWAAAQAKPEQVQSIYQDTPLAGLEECSMFLGRVEGQTLRAVLQRGSGGPMLSFIQSNLGLDALRQHLARFVRVRTNDGQWLVARWGCPVVAPVLAHALTPAQKALLHSGFVAWYLINRQGTLDVLHGSMEMQATLPFEDVTGMLEHGYTMSDEAFAHVIAATEADALLSHIGLQSPHVLAQRLPSSLHGMATYALDCMNALEVSQAPGRLALLHKALQQPSAQAALDLIKAHRNATPATA